MQYKDALVQWGTEKMTRAFSDSGNTNLKDKDIAPESVSLVIRKNHLELEVLTINGRTVNRNIIVFVSAENGPPGSMEAKIVLANTDLSVILPVSALNNIQEEIQAIQDKDLLISG